MNSFILFRPVVGLCKIPTLVSILCNWLGNNFFLSMSILFSTLLGCNKFAMRKTVSTFLYSRVWNRKLAYVTKFGPISKTSFHLMLLYIWRYPITSYPHNEAFACNREHLDLTSFYYFPNQREFVGKWGVNGPITGCCWPWYSHLVAACLGKWVVNLQTVSPRWSISPA